MCLCTVTRLQFQPSRSNRRGTLTTLSGSNRFNKYISIAARATRQALKEEERLKADKRGTVTLKWQTWKEGKGSAQVRLPFSLSLGSKDPRADWCANDTLQEWVVPPVEEAHK